MLEVEGPGVGSGLEVEGPGVLEVEGEGPWVGSGLEAETSAGALDAAMQWMACNYSKQDLLRVNCPSSRILGLQQPKVPRVAKRSSRMAAQYDLLKKKKHLWEWGHEAEHRGSLIIKPISSTKHTKNHVMGEWQQKIKR